MSEAKYSPRRFESTDEEKATVLADIGKISLIADALAIRRREFTTGRVHSMLRFIIDHANWDWDRMMRSEIDADTLNMDVAILDAQSVLHGHISVETFQASRYPKIDLARQMAFREGKLWPELYAATSLSEAQPPAQL